jgi:cytosine deaminase
MSRRLLLRRARLAPPLLQQQNAADSPWIDADIVIEAGTIAGIHPEGVATDIAADVDILDLGRGLVMPAFVDCHTHIDKAHLIDRADFPEFGLMEAIAAMEALKARWTEADLIRRAQFALSCAYAHGVRAMRSHVDWRRSTPSFVWPALAALRREWQGRVDLQLAPLIPLDEAEDETLLGAAIRAAETGGGVIGFFVYEQEPLARRLEDVIARASVHDLDLDFHIDEGLDPALRGLRALTDRLAARRFKGRVLCGHCVSSSLLSAADLADLLIRMRDTGIHVVTLPQTNLALQDRHPARSPRLRGMAPIREFAAAGIPVSIGTDNVRDGFYAFGDHDPLEALALAAHVAHLPDAARLWPASITVNPARAMGLSWDGVIRRGAPADLVLFEARSGSELFARHGTPRRILRAGRWVVASLPSHAELDGE